MLRQLSGRILLLIAISMIAPPARAGLHEVVAGVHTIQPVIDAAVEGDTLLLSGEFGGVGNRLLDAAGKNLVYLGNSESPAVLDGGGETIFLFQSGESVSTVVEDITLRGSSAAVICRGSSWPRFKALTFTQNFGNASSGVGGAALLCEDGASPRLTGCRFENNAHFKGGAVALVGTGSPLFLDCDFVLNNSAWGGAVHVAGGAPSIERAQFSSNTAYPFTGPGGEDEGGDGGAIHIEGGQLTLTDILAVDNLTSALVGSPDEGGHGAAICVGAAGEVVMTGSTLSGNVAARSGGGVHLFGGALLTISSSLLATNGPDGLYGEAGALLDISCSNLFGNGVADYAGALIDATGTLGNLSVDPIFCGGVAPDLPYGLHEDSPCLPGGNGCGVQMGRFGLACSGNMAVHEVPGEFATIQEALDVAVDGDTVLVAPGFYRGEGNKGLNPGGKAIVILSEIGPAGTFIDCEGSGRGFLFLSGETPATVVSGFTIMGGMEPVGGGVACIGGSPTLENLVIAGNHALSQGGGLVCIFASPVLLDVTLRNNSSDDDGGAIYSMSGSAPQLSGVRIHDNTAADDGGGIYCSEGSLDLTHCTVAFNTVGGDGGGIMARNGAQVTLNATLVTFATTGGGLWAESGAVITPICSDVFGNTDGDYLGEAIDVTGQYGNISLDPLFCDPEARDLALDADSPCLGANNACGLDMGALGQGCDLPYMEISGRLAEADETPVADATFTGYYYQVRSGDDGRYQLLVPPLWSGTLTPHLDGYVFDPLSREYLNVATDLPNQDYLASRTTLRLVPQDYPDLQSALSASLSGDSVLVAAGVYRGGGNKRLDFGGRDIVLKSVSGPAVTIIDCEGGARAFDFDEGEGPGAVVEGFTIRGGHVWYEFESNSGGAIRVSGASPTLRDLVIEDCRAKGAGGGIAMAGSNSLVEDVVLSRNETYGVTYGNGGGIAVFDGAPTLRRILLHDNTAAESGGGIYQSGGVLLVEGCTLASNTATRGGALGLDYAADMTCSNLLVTHCGATQGGVAHAADSPSALSWSCSNLFENLGEEFTGFASPPGADSFSADPIYCDPERDDYAVAEQSPCLPENNDCGLQVGALGLGCTLTSGTPAPAEFFLAQNHPNPFNPSTEIRFGLSEPCAVTLEVYDLAGRRRALLLDAAALPAGEQRVRWEAVGEDGRPLASGVYFARLRAGGRELTRKLTLLK